MSEQPDQRVISRLFRFDVRMARNMGREHYRILSPIFHDGDIDSEVAAKVWMDNAIRKACDEGWAFRRETRVEEPLAESGELKPEE